MRADEINEQIESLESKGQVSDGCHTFDELYYHRMVLFAVVCDTYKGRAWKSKLHADGTMFDDYFVAGVDTPEGSFTYHYHLDHWDRFSVPELGRAPEWDGHTADDITRLFSLLPPETEKPRDLALEISITDTAIFKHVLQLLSAVYRRTQENETKSLIENWLKTVLDDTFDVDRILHGR